MSLIRKLQYSLDSLGLSEQEIAFYLAVVKNPDSTIFSVSKACGIPKDRCYKICEGLEDIKLISIKGERNRKLKALPLDHFISIAKSKGRKLQRSAQTLQEISPYLGYLQLDGNGEMIESYYGDDIGDKWLDLTYLNWDQVQAFGDFSVGIESVGEEVDKQFTKRRLKKGAKAYPILANPSGYSIKILQNDTQEMRHSKVINNEKLTNYFVTLVPDHDLTVLWSRDKEGWISGATIKSALMTDFYQKLYEHFHEQAKNNNFLKSEN